MGAVPGSGVQKSRYGKSFFPRTAIAGSSTSAAAVCGGCRACSCSCSGAGAGSGSGSGAPAQNRAAQTASATHAVAIGHLEELVRQGGDHKSERSGLGDASGRGALAPATTSSTAAAVCHRAPPPNALCSRAMGCPRSATGRGRVKSLHDLLRLLGRPFDGRCRVPAAAAVARLFRHTRSTVHTVSASLSARHSYSRTLSIDRSPPQGLVQSVYRLPCLRRTPPVGRDSRAVYPVSGLTLYYD